MDNDVRARHHRGGPRGGHPAVLDPVHGRGEADAQAVRGGEAAGHGGDFVVLLGPDYAGKSTALAALTADPVPWRVVTVDEPDHLVVSRLRRHLVADVLPSLGTAYSVDFAASLMQTAVVYLRDRLLADDRPAIVDSYYYKILAKCRLAGIDDNPMYAWWRSFPQPRRVLYLDVSPQTAWWRSRAGRRANRLEHYGPRPGRRGFEAYQTDLRALLFEEVRHLPVTVLREGCGAGDIREALSHEYA